jgi:uncharacterized protein (UPF0210 family)
VVRSARTREYWHLDLSGAPTVESSEVLADALEAVSCRWCGSGAAVEVVDRPDA